MKVAVIGAGFSGMLAAYLLEKEGIEVTIYEKEEVIGGHCRTLTSKDFNIDLATVFSFKEHIKELLLELQVDYHEGFTYRNFLNEDYQSVEQLSPNDVKSLIGDLDKLDKILKKYDPSLKSMNYDYIHEDLLMPLSDFLQLHNLHTICDVIAPHLSSYGYGNIDEVQAFYAFKVFNTETIYSFILSEKFLFIDNGTSSLIKKLSQNITDIRYSIEVKNIKHEGNKVKVESPFGIDYYDKVLITTKLPRNVIKDELLNQFMGEIDTHPYFTCAYEVDTRNLVTTYFKANLGKTNCIQFYHPKKQKDRTVIVTYTYGQVSKDVVNGITDELKASGVDVKHLITTKQWYIFPHLKKDNLTSTFYEELNKHQANDSIMLIGSLICEPSISKLYVSVKESIRVLLEDN